MPAIDPNFFLDDPQVKPFVRTRRVDLAAPAAQLDVLSQGKTAVYRQSVPDGQVEVIQYIAPFVEERTDIGTPQESFQRIPAARADGWFAFNPLVNNQPPLVLEINMNRPTAIATPSNIQRAVASGLTFMSDDPWADALRFNPNFAFPVPSGQELLVTFELLPEAVTGPIPNPYQIGAGIKRVDFAGVVVFGMVMPQSVYNRLQQGQEKIYDAQLGAANKALS